MAEIPLAPIQRLIRKAGAHRVGEDAAAALRDYVEKECLEYASMAVELAAHAGRKTVRAVDIDLAIRR
jgi:histone H3/H4